MRQYRINADLWTELVDILVSTPDEFNSDFSRKWVTLKNGWSGYKYTGALRGRKDSTPDIGRMTDKVNVDNLLFYRDRGMIDYVIYSYETPIAYRIRNKNGEPVWFDLNDEKYSVTTSKHQGKVSTALSVINRTP